MVPLGEPFKPKQMTNEKKKELFPFFALLYSKQLNPEKYGAIEDIEEWSKALESNEEDVNKVIAAATELSDEDWDSLEKQYTEQTATQEVPMAMNGAKLEKIKKLKGLKKGGPVAKKAKKCACGCDIIETKEAGGKISSTCSCKCGGKVKKGEEGISLRSSSEKVDFIKSAPTKVRNIYEKMKAKKIK